MDNTSFIREVVHVQSGEKIDVGFVAEVTYIESMQLDGPKVIISFSDDLAIIKDRLQIKEFDELTLTFIDAWTTDQDISENFTVLVIRTIATICKMSLISTSVYNMKVIADKTRIFTQRGVPEIINVFSSGLKQDIASFPIVEDYHCIAGERPTRLLRQLADEHGAHIWVARGSVYMRTFAELMAKEHSYEYHFLKEKEKYTVISYRVPSNQNNMEEQILRSYTGWNPTQGRIKANSDNSGTVPQITSAKSTYVLGNAPTAMCEAIDFTCYGNAALTPGMVLKLVWNQPDPTQPINEGLPEKVVIQLVSHWYSAQKYRCRVKGAVQLESAKK